MNLPINLFEYEAIAAQHLSTMAYDYYVSGAWDEITLKDNRNAYQRYKLRPRMLRDVSKRHLNTSLLGTPLSMPILIALRPNRERDRRNQFTLPAGMDLANLVSMAYLTIPQVEGEDYRI
jgi:hypothetical protein